MGGYIGVANYVCLNGSISTQVNKFFYANPGEARAARPNTQKNMGGPR